MVRAVTPIPFVKARFFDRCGKPLTGGKIYTYEANTTTPKVTYKDPYGLTPNTNPIILDAAGEADIYLDGTYRIRITDRNDVLVNDVAKIGSWFSENLQDALNNVSMAMTDALKPILQNLDDVINTAAAAGAGANGWTDTLIAVSENINQRQVNDGLESIAQLLSIKNPRDGMRVYVKSYHAGLNKGGGMFVYDSSKVNINDGGVIINGWVRQDIRFVSPEIFGAKCDGVYDDRQSVQNCVNYLSSKGGGTLRLTDNDYFLNSKTNETGTNTDTLIFLKPNVSIVGNGKSSKIKIGKFDNAKFYVFYNYTTNLGDVSFRDFYIDANGQNNLPLAIHGHDQWCIAVGIANSVLINNVHVENAGGQQVFSIGSNENVPTVNIAHIIKNKIYKVAGDITNNIQGDHSSIYCAAKKATIALNTLWNDNEQFGVATAIECHAIRQLVIGNNIENYKVGVITAATVRSLTDVLIANNNIKARYAWHLWASPTFEAQRISFDKNNCHQVGNDNYALIDLSSTVLSHNSGIIKISGNTLTGAGNAVDTQGNFGILVGDTRNTIIKSNVFKNIIGRAVNLDNIKSDGLVNIDIDDNKFIDCNSTLNADYKDLMAFNLLATINRLSIRHNEFVSNSATYSKRVLNGVCSVKDFEFIDNREVGIGFVNPISWDSGKLTKATIKHETKILGRPSIPASAGSKWTTLSDNIVEYFRYADAAPNAYWNAVFYLKSSLPQGVFCFHGDKVINLTPVTGDPSGWVCIVAGNPGQWAYNGTLTAV